MDRLYRNLSHSDSMESVLLTCVETFDMHLGKKDCNWGELPDVLL